MRFRSDPGPAEFRARRQPGKTKPENRNCRPGPRSGAQCHRARPCRAIPGPGSSPGRHRKRLADWVVGTPAARNCSGKRLISKDISTRTIIGRAAAVFVFSVSLQCNRRRRACISRELQFPRDRSGTVSIPIPAHGSAPESAGARPDRKRCRRAGGPAYRSARPGGDRQRRALALSLHADDRRAAAGKRYRFTEPSPPRHLPAAGRTMPHAEKRLVSCRSIQ